MAEKAGKSFTERLRDRATQGVAQAGQRNRAAFLAARSDIESALAEKWPVRLIWEQLVDEGRITFGYAWFAKFVRNIIRPDGGATSRSGSPAALPVASTPEESVRADLPPVPAAEVPTPEPPPRPKAGIGSTFRVTPTPNRKDLIGE